ncbi:hypothetical protein BCR42DRAFT_416886 [Absidia repens]|uniref:BTB domain-containing protein n=1 Tax=Absidia repens TaxID=90262 RepID=A0A1X2IF65_9FUNG|nr:hypothetical protein BCR42DRAFT_416886 [Absidia repens]
MEPSRYRSHQQSPTYRSPEACHPTSLMGLAQSYERNNGKPTAAQQFAHQQLQQLQQLQHPVEYPSPGSSTAVDSATTFGTTPVDTDISSKTTTTTTTTTTSATTHDSTMSDFGSAVSINNDLIHCLLNTAENGTTQLRDNDTKHHLAEHIDDDDDDDDEEEEEEEQHIKRQGHRYKQDRGASADNNSNNNNGHGDDLQTKPLWMMTDHQQQEQGDLDGDWRQTQDEELRGYRRTPRSHLFFLQLNKSATTTTTTTDEDDDDLESIHKKNGDIGAIIHDGASDYSGGNGIWYDYQPDYGMLNESYQTTKRNIYKDIQLTLGHLQQLETRFESSKAQFHDQIEKEYEEWSYQLDVQRRTLAQHKRQLHDSEPQSLTTFPNKIKLNVGGDIFETSLATLKKDRSSLLAAMFSGKHPIDSDHEGSYFIDRDPTHFRLVLNYLRDLRISPSVIQDKIIAQELLQEAQFYHIEGLIKLLEQ